MSEDQLNGGNRNLGDTRRLGCPSGRWFKRVDPDTAHDPLVEIDTDNLIHEIRTPVAGVLAAILVKDVGWGGMSQKSRGAQYAQYCPPFSNGHDRYRNKSAS